MRARAVFLFVNSRYESPNGDVIKNADAHPQVQVEDFTDAELMLDITEHTLVPEHQVGETYKDL